MIGNNKVIDKSNCELTEIEYIIRAYFVLKMQHSTTTSLNTFLMHPYCIHFDEDTNMHRLNSQELLHTTDDPSLRSMTLMPPLREIESAYYQVCITDIVHKWARRS
jgi:hypothetical protein